MRIGVLGVLALGLLTAACGSNTQERSATGGLSGLAVGAAVGGPVGAAVGAAAGAVGGWAMPEGAETLAINGLHRERTATAGALGSVGLGSGSGSSQANSAQTVKQAQAELQREGLYRGPIDGIAGPDTKQALAAYQAREGLQQSAMLDQATLQHLNLGGAAPRQAAARPALTADQIRDRLQAEGYANVSSVQAQSPRFYTAQADRGNDSYRLRVDARSGQVVSERRVAAASQGQGGASASGGATSGTTTPPEDSGAGSATTPAPNTGAGAPSSTSTSTGASPSR